MVGWATPQTQRYSAAVVQHPGSARARHRRDPISRRQHDAAGGGLGRRGAPGAHSRDDGQRSQIEGMRDLSRVSAELRAHLPDAPRHSGDGSEFEFLVGENVSQSLGVTEDPPGHIPFQCLKSPVPQALLSHTKPLPLVNTKAVESGVDLLK